MASLGENMIVEWNWDGGSRQGQSMSIEQTDDFGSAFGTYYDEFGLEPMYID